MTTVPSARQTIPPVFPFFLATNSIPREVFPTRTILAVASRTSPA
jgi:hypothetical protein